MAIVFERVLLASSCETELISDLSADVFMRVQCFSDSVDLSISFALVLPPNIGNCHFVLTYGSDPQGEYKLHFGHGTLVHLGGA